MNDNEREEKSRQLSNQIIAGLCRKWVEREQALGLKGKKADDDAIAYLAGAATALAPELPSTSAALGRFLSLIVAVRGAMAVRQKAAER